MDSSHARPPTPIYLSEDDIVRLLQPAEIYEVVFDTLVASAAGRVLEGAKTGFAVDDEHGVRFMGGAPAYLHDGAVAGIKWFVTCAENGRRGLPRVPATVVLCDSVTGVLRGVVDAMALTAWRTAALAVAAIKPCAREPVAKAAVIGLGAIGKGVVHYLTAELGVRQISVSGRDLDRTRRDAARIARELAVDIEASHSVADAVRDAEIVVTATGLKRDDPLLFGDWIKPGVTVCGLGSYQEIDEALVMKAGRIFADNPEGCAQRGNLAPLFKSGRLRPDQVAGTVADVVAGRVPGRTSPDDIVVVALIGLGALDIALGAHAIKRAIATGHGQRLVPAADRVAWRTGQHG